MKMKIGLLMALALLATTEAKAQTADLKSASSLAGSRDAKVTLVY